MAAILTRENLAVAVRPRVSGVPERMSFAPKATEGFISPASSRQAPGAPGDLDLVGSAGLKADFREAVKSQRSPLLMSQMRQLRTLAEKQKD